jgi:hypothetical protein
LDFVGSRVARRCVPLNIGRLVNRPLSQAMRVIAGSLEAWTGMWAAEPARRDGTVATNPGAVEPAHGDRLANIPQGE